MATQREHIYAIQNIINRGVSPDDNRLSNRLILHYLKQARSVLIKRKLDKQYWISRLNYQTVCIPLEEHTYHDCSCIPEDLGCTVLRSTCEIPKDINSRWGSTINAKFADGRIIAPFTMTSNTYTKYSRSNQQPKRGWFLENGRLYLIPDALHQRGISLRVVLLTALWEDPEDLAGFCNCNSSGEIDENDPCYSGDSEFPIDPELVLPMYQMVLELLNIAMQYPEDNENNSKQVEVTNEREV